MTTTCLSDVSIGLLYDFVDIILNNTGLVVFFGSYSEHALSPSIIPVPCSSDSSWDGRPLLHLHIHCMKVLIFTCAVKEKLFL